MNRAVRLFSLPSGVWLDRVRVAGYVIGESLLAVILPECSACGWDVVELWLYVVGSRSSP